MARPLKVGDPVPAFDAEASDGERWSRERLRGRPFVLYFYPRDQTPGCTAQACAFRDDHQAFRALDVPVLGVSRDGLDAHRRFAERHSLPFPLLADKDGRMHEAFGATHLGLLPRRVSYLVDADGRVAAVHDSHFRAAAHAERMLEAARALASKK